jgi:flagellar biosynthesis protein FlhG
VFTVSSGKGGVGKSNMSLNLACLLNSIGRKVLIIDTDYGFANINVLAGVTPRYTVKDLFEYEDIDIHDVMIDYDGIKIIPGGNDVFDIESMNETQINQLQAQFTSLKDIDTIIVDTAAGINATVMSYIIFADEAILVTTPEVTAVTDVYSMLKNISVMNLKKRARIIINRCENENEAFETFAKLKHVSDTYLNLELDYLGFVFDDPLVSKAVKEQVPFTKLYPKSKATRSLVSVAHNLIGIEEQLKGSTIKEVYSKIYNIFSR